MNEAEYHIHIQGKNIQLKGSNFTVDSIVEGEKNTIFIFNDVSTENKIESDQIKLSQYTFEHAIGESQIYKNMLDLCKKESFSLNPLLLMGENGTQKDHLAAMIHNNSIRHDNKFINITNHSSLYNLSYNEIELNENALRGNTICIEEVGNLSFDQQKVLLEILNNSLYLNVKVICCTERNLFSAFPKEDIYPELFSILENNIIRVPALRTRGKDVLLYADYYLAMFNKEYNRNISLDKSIEDLMLHYSWKNNIQELKNMLSCIIQQLPETESVISTKNIPDFILLKFKEDKKDMYNLANAERELIIRAMNDFSSGRMSKSKVAKELGISLATLYRKLSEYGINENKIFE